MRAPPLPTPFEGSLRRGPMRTNRPWGVRPPVPGVQPREPKNVWVQPPPKPVPLKKCPVEKGVFSPPPPPPPPPQTWNLFVEHRWYGFSPRFVLVEGFFLKGPPPAFRHPPGSEKEPPETVF